MLPPHPPARRKKSTPSQPAKRAAQPSSGEKAAKAVRQTPHLRILGRTPTPPRFITAKSRRLAEC
jgi:hypothetical protein